MGLVASINLSSSISAYGAHLADRFATGGGEPEDLLRNPFDTLVASVAHLLGISEVVLAGEHHLADERVRPDFAVHQAGALVGFAELKAPGKGADPSRFKGHDKRQWERLACLPNVLYTDGQSFGLYRDGEGVGPIVRLTGDVMSVGAGLAVDDADTFLELFRRFLQWSPIPPRRPKDLAQLSARLCRLLRAEVEELVPADAGLRALADDWRQYLFPDATDAEFSDRYAQAVTFALLLARVEEPRRPQAA